MLLYNRIEHVCRSLNIFVRERKIRVQDKINYCINIWAGASQGSIVKTVYTQGISITKQAVSKCMLKWQEVMNWNRYHETLRGVPCLS
jgi:hypothetical protein